MRILSLRPHLDGRPTQPNLTYQDLVALEVEVEGVTHILHGGPYRDPR